MTFRIAAWTTIALLLCLLIAGTFVNSSRAALSVPDWPLSYGRLLMTNWPGNIFWEQLHRLMVAISAIALIALMIIARREDTRTRRTITIAFTLFVVQVLLGGVIVLKLNPPPVSATHVVIAQLILALIISVAPPAPAPFSRPRLAIATTSLLVIQIILGAMSRHPASKPLFIATLLAHMLTGLAIVLFIVFALRRVRVLLLLVLLQLAVAVPLVIISPEPLADEWPPPRYFRATHAAHVVLAALLLGSSARLLRYDRPS